MNKLKYILYCFIVFPLFGNALTLEETIKENLYHNPQIKVSIENYKASYYELQRVKSGDKPTVNISGEVGRERTKIDYSFEGNRQLNEQQMAIVGRYNLFEGYKNRYRIIEKESALEVAKNQLLQKMNKISLSIIQVYLQVLWKKALIAIEEENYQNHLETLRKVKIRLEAGDGYESDYRQTKARVKLAEVNRLLAQRVYLNTKINYRRFINRVPDISAMSKPLISFTPNETEIESFITKAYQKNFTLQAQKAQLNISKALYTQEKSSDYPTLDLEVSQTWSSNVHGFEGGDNSQKVAVVLNYNIYNGGTDKASQLSALKRSAIEEESLEDMKLLVEEEIRVSLMKYEMIEKQIALTDEQLNHLSGTKELYELEYQNSKRTIIDLLNIKQEYSHAQTQKINAIFDRLLTYYQFRSVIGELLSEFKLDIPLEIK